MSTHFYSLTWSNKVTLYEWSVTFCIIISQTVQRKRSGNTAGNAPVFPEMRNVGRPRLNVFAAQQFQQQHQQQLRVSCPQVSITSPIREGTQKVVEICSVQE